MIADVTMIKDIVTIVAALGGVLGAYLGLRRYFRESADREARSVAEAEIRQRERIREWQMAVVYDILIKSQGPQSFDELRRLYVTEAVSVDGLTIPKSDLNPLVLRRILADLISKNLVFHLGGDSYLAGFTPMSASQVISDQLLRDNLSVTESTMRILQVEPGRYDFDGLVHKVAYETKVDESRVRLILTAAVGQRQLLIDQDGKVRVWAPSQASVDDV